MKYQTVFLGIYLMIKILYLSFGQNLDIHNLRFTFYDVGQGDSILITTPSHKKVLIDGGPDYSVDYLLSKKMPFWNCRLDLVVLTHPHSDHIVGLNRILERCEVSKVIYNNVKYNSSFYRYWESLTNHLTVFPGVSSSKFELDGVYFTIVWPDSAFLAGNIKDINDTSVTILVEYGSHKTLLSGDVTEKYLSFIKEKMNLYKVSHHGSLKSHNEEFLKGIAPNTCVISVGKENTFGHPESKVLQSLDTNCKSVFRTDIEHSIDIVINAL